MPARLGQPQPDGESTGRCFALPSRIGDSRLDVRQRDETESVLDLDEQCGLCAISRHGMARLATVAPCANLIVAGVDVRSLSLAATSMSPILCVSFRHDVVWLTSGFEMQSWRADLERHAIVLEASRRCAQSNRSKRIDRFEVS